MLQKLTASLAADQGLLLAGDGGSGGSGGSGGNGEGGTTVASGGSSIMNALQESNQQLGASMNKMYEKECALERQRLEMMSSMMQANQLQNQQMVRGCPWHHNQRRTSVTVMTIVTKPTSPLCFDVLVV
jgi:hypothetical protein